jgi:hypothetical protein
MAWHTWGTLAVAASLLLSGTPAAVAARSADVWAPPGRLPLSDRAAARLVVRQPEVMPENQAQNSYVPTNRELRAFYKARDSYHHKIVKYNPLFAYVTGRPGIKNPSTDDLVLWTAYKWGIPVDIVKAIVFVESRGRQHARGDLTTVPKRWYAKYPARFRVPPRKVYESVGITQVIWAPDGSNGAGTGSLRWNSTAFNLDYMAATVRYYYDGRCYWCGPNYHAGQAMASVGAWNAPRPWNANARVRLYLYWIGYALTNHQGQMF